MSEVFFVAAWAAGVVEGGSVLTHFSRNEENRPMIFVPSLLYGTLALPMGLVGASPGPSLVEALPFAPSLKEEPANDGEIDVLKEATEEVAVDEASETNAAAAISSRAELIRKVRDDNRRNLALKQQKQQPMKRAVVPQHTKWLAGLDGRPLATPLAEAMRRARFLCVGAGLVMTMVSFQYKRYEEEQQQEALMLQQRRQGRDAGAIQSLVQQTDTKASNGVVVRLVGQHEQLDSVTRSDDGVVVPIVYSVDDDRLLSKMNTDVAYWNLGSTLQEWRQTPLTKDWLFSPNDDSSFSSLVVEADISSTNSLVDYLGMQQDEDTYSSMDRALWVSTILGMVARQKGVLPQLNDEKTNADPINIIIGSNNIKPKNDHMVYIHGPTAVGVEVVSLLERMYNQTAASSRTDNVSNEGDAEAAMGNQVLASSSDGSEVVTEDRSEEVATVEQGQPPFKFPQSMDDAFSLMEMVGRKLRQGGERTVTEVCKLFEPGDKVVHVLSDHDSSCCWLRQTLSGDWSVASYDVNSSIDKYHKAVEKNQGVTFVCCSNDDATCSMICSLLTEEAARRTIVVLVEDEACASMLSTLCAELNQEASVEIVSVKGIHRRLFDHARDLLASGKTPSQVQELIDLIQ